MEEDAVLVVGKGVVDLLVPNDAAAGGRYVHELEPEGMADEVIRQHHGTLQTSVRPSVTVGVGDVKFGDGDGVNLVSRLGHCALHRLLVLIRENRRHGDRRVRALGLSNGEREEGAFEGTVVLCGWDWGAGEVSATVVPSRCPAAAQRGDVSCSEIRQHMDCGGHVGAPNEAGEEEGYNAQWQCGQTNRPRGELPPCKDKSWWVLWSV